MGYDGYQIAGRNPWKASYGFTIYILSLMAGHWKRHTPLIPMRVRRAHSAHRLSPHSFRTTAIQRSRDSTRYFWQLVFLRLTFSCTIASFSMVVVLLGAYHHVPGELQPTMRQARAIIKDRIDGEKK